MVSDGITRRETCKPLYTLVGDVGLNNILAIFFEDDIIRKYKTFLEVKTYECVLLGPLLLTWFNFNPSMYK